jgi:Lar family restriction alleviation protein
MLETLKPCPFCGHKAVLKEALRWHGAFRVECSNCDATVWATGVNNPASAIAHWNQRVQPHESGETERTEQIAAAFRAGFHAAAPPGTDDIEWEQGEWLDYQAALSASRPDAGDGTGEP